MSIHLHTGRLIIRENTWTDLADLHRLLSGDEMYYLQDISTKSLEESKENLEVSISEAGRVDREKFFFAIEEAETKKFVGQIGFTILERTPGGFIGEMGYFMLREFWGRGYGTEAARAVIEFAFKETDCHKMLIGCNAENVDSERIIMKLGATKEAHHKSHQYLENRWCDRVVYGLIKD